MKIRRMADGGPHELEGSYERMAGMRTTGRLFNLGWYLATGSRFGQLVYDIPDFAERAKTCAFILAIARELRSPRDG